MMSLILHNKLTKQSSLFSIIYLFSFFNIYLQSNFLLYMLNTGWVPQKALLRQISFTGKVTQFFHGHEFHPALLAPLQNSKTETLSESLHDLNKWQISVMRNASFPTQSYKTLFRMTAHGDKPRLILQERQFKTKMVFKLEGSNPTCINKVVSFICGILCWSG